MPRVATVPAPWQAILKLSYLSQPARVYRGVKEVGLELPSEFLTVEEGKFAGGVEVRWPRRPRLTKY